jgi:hypothetical protein
MSEDSGFVPAGTYKIRAPEFTNETATLTVDNNSNGTLMVNGQVVATGEIVPGGTIDGQIIADIELGDPPPYLIYFEPRHYWYLAPQSE